MPPSTDDNLARCCDCRSRCLAAPGAGVKAPLLQYLRSAPADPELINYSSILLGIIATYGRHPHCVARHRAAELAESAPDNVADVVVAMYGLENLLLYLRGPWAGHLDLALTAVAGLLQVSCSCAAAAAGAGG